jgi:hypothetical protein
MRAAKPIPTSADSRTHWSILRFRAKPLYHLSGNLESAILEYVHSPALAVKRLRIAVAIQRTIAWNDT